MDINKIVWRGMWDGKIALQIYGQDTNISFLFHAFRILKKSDEYMKELKEVLMKDDRIYSNPYSEEQ